MALDLTGIQNVEFYSGHYLDAVLEGDLKSVFSRWAEREKEQPTFKAPQKTLASLAAKYFKLRSESEGEPSAIARWRLARDFHADLVDALGYTYAPSVEPLDGDEVVPVVLSLKRDGNPFLWVLDTGFPGKEDDDPLGDHPHSEQIPPDFKGSDLPNSTWRELLDERIFRLERPPRWVLVLSGTEALLTERNKWVQGKYLRFELGELLGRKETAALRATAALLHRDVLAPDDGLPLHDTLDENSHKHAYAVSGDLKHGVRRAVELLANEAVWYRREVQKKGVFEDEELASKLSAESLTWLYRLLFLFYVEARGAELGIVPMDSDAYREGYSLEALRDLELVPLTTSAAREGFYIHESLRKLFGIVNMGFPSIDLRRKLAFDDIYQNTMKVDALNSPLFSDDRLEVLRGVKFRNFVIQEILQLLSLSAEKKRKTRGRISYAQLGINQLGAVYEGLLSYTGFFATEDLHEVASEKDNKKLSGKPAAEREALKTYFVPASRIGDYKVGEIVRDENEKKVVHRKGAFIFRLAGRNREKSASYYTPEVLTRCLVKYALKELLWEEGEDGEKPRRKKTADEILALTICEPAMGSSAFLIEAVDQLADAYLEAKQEELGKAIPPEKFQYEKRRVKARLATNNCYGVDLNPTAVELARVSLWLATLHEDGKCPWFGLRLATGNSLVGARREVFKTTDVTRPNKKANPNWLGLVSEPVSLYHGEDGPPIDEKWTAPPRPNGTIYHFLLPAEGMAAFDKDKVINELVPESVKRIKEWRKEFCKPFNKKDAERLEQVSDAVDRLFAQVVRERVLATQETSDRIPVWGEPQSHEVVSQQPDLLVRDQEEVAASLEDGSSAYRRLKLAMDAWCALWFWPIEAARLLPDRATWIAQLELILNGQVTYNPTYEQGELFADLTPVDQDERAASRASREVVAPYREASAERLKRLQEFSDALRERRSDYFEEWGLADIESVLEADASLRSAQEAADRLRFHHWQLRFSEVFASNGGFDLVLGNPPWVLLSFDESGVLSDFESTVEIRSLGASQVSKLRAEILKQPSPRSAFVEEFESQVGTQGYLGDGENYPLLAGMKANLYKCFITRAFGISRDNGVAAFLHPEGVFDDPAGGLLREDLYPRLRQRYSFQNELKLFPEVGHTRTYGLSVYGSRRASSPDFVCISNLFHPSTISASYSHDGLGEVAGIKTDDNEWCIAGHRNRLVRITLQELTLFANLYGDADCPALRAPLPLLHSRETVNVLSKISASPRLGSSGDSWGTTPEWNETNRTKDGTLSRSTEYPDALDELIISGPYIYVGNPLYKTPNEGCRGSSDYTALDLENIDLNSYLPRTLYQRSCSKGEYRTRSPKWKGKVLFDSYRHAHRKMVSPLGERTLVPTILPPGIATTGLVLTIAFDSEGELLCFNALATSLVVDFFVKTMGRTDIYPDQAAALPVLAEPDDRLNRRCLRLNCLTPSYASLWGDAFSMAPDGFASRDRRFGSWDQLTPNWSDHSGLRADLERRQALLEIDVLGAMAMGLSILELLAVYRIQFPVLQKFERQRTYDQRGRVVPTSKTASGNPAVSLVELAATLKEQAGFDVHAEYHPDGSNTQELRKQKTRIGKKEAGVLGVSERCTMADLLAETEVRWSDEDHPEGRPVPLVGLRYTDPGLEPRMERVYPTPWTRCDREVDYRQAWAEFERRLGKKMPKGTPL